MWHSQDPEIWAVLAVCSLLHWLHSKISPSYIPPLEEQVGYWSFHWARKCSLGNEKITCLVQLSAHDLITVWGWSALPRTLFLGGGIRDMRKAEGEIKRRYMLLLPPCLFCFPSHWTVWTLPLWTPGCGLALEPSLFTSHIRSISTFCRHLHCYNPGWSHRCLALKLL